MKAWTNEGHKFSKKRQPLRKSAKTFLTVNSRPEVVELWSGVTEGDEDIVLGERWQLVQFWKQQENC